MKETAIIVDIDGTLANIDHRRHFIERKCTYEHLHPHCRDTVVRIDDPKGKPNWKSFNEAMKDDVPNEWCIEMIKKFAYPCGYDFGTDILFVSGREEIYRETTVSQIDEWIDIGWKKLSLFMRNTKDNRSDVDVKLEIYEKYIKDKYDILFVIDDRKVVVDMWRSLGLVCLDCRGYQG